MGGMAKMAKRVGSLDSLVMRIDVSQLQIRQQLPWFDFRIISSLGFPGVVCVGLLQVANDYVFIALKEYCEASIVTYIMNAEPTLVWNTSTALDGGFHIGYIGLAFSLRRALRLHKRAPRMYG
jgi:hypothetical protein